VHDFNVDLFTSGAKVSSGLNTFLVTGDSEAYVNELGAMKGVKSVASSDEKYTYIQGDVPTDRVSFVTRVTITQEEAVERYRYYVVDGSRLPSE
jgi:hypothetical protein